MASIRDLLNPLPEPRHPHLNGYSRVETPSSPKASMVSPAREKRPKMTKDGPVFRQGSVQGELRYPPCEERDEHLAKIHAEWRLHPMGRIADYPRHIPYQSDKKNFQEKTGRDSFHVFQYTFQIPGERGPDGKAKEWTVMWDYNIGLVRTTPLFKCNDFPKTTPGKVLNQNPGLRDICHSITGGALAAQGYWMPFEAAKAIAATFCWKIRYVLTPLFGTDFPSMCIPPTDRARFTRMIIDPAIVKQATETANKYQSLELQNHMHSLTAYSETESTTSSSPPQRTREIEIPVGDSRPARQPFPKLPRHRYTDSIGSARDSSSEPFCVSPQSPTGSAWTPVNAPPPRSSEIVPRSRVPSPRHFYTHAAAFRNKHLSVEESESETDLSSEPQSDTMPTPEFSSLNEDIEMGEADFSESLSDVSLSDENGSLNGDEVNQDYRGPRSRASLGTRSPIGKKSLKKNPRRSAIAKDGARLPGSGHFAHEVKAAHALLHLHMQEATTEDLDNEAPADEHRWPSSLELAFRPSNLASNRKRRRASL